MPDVEKRTSALPGEWRTDIQETAQNLREEHTRALEQLRDRHLQAQFLGILLLVVGVGLATAGNLV